MYARHVSLAVFAMFALVLAGCQTEPKNQSDRAELQNDAQRALDDMTARDASLRDLLNNAAGYAIFPDAGKGAVVVGGAFGRGPVYRHGQFIGWAKIEEGSIGAQIGGQKYRELLVFKTDAGLDRFLDSQFSLDANASAIILREGAAKAAFSDKDVAVFVDPVAGAMAEAAVGGQHFAYEAANRTNSERMNNPTTQPTRTETETRTETIR